MVGTNSYKQDIIEYYNFCWLDRFKQGHNPKSHAMHMGYFETELDLNDEAKYRMNEFLATHFNLDIEQHKLIVDAGCGIGGTSIFLAENYSGLDILGVNISAEQIEMARQLIAERQQLKSKISFLCQDYANTTIANETVDIVYAIESICHAIDKDEFYAEAFRILKPGGKLFIIDYVDTESRKESDAGLMEVFKSGWVVNSYIVMPTEKLQKHGFGNVKISSITDKVMPGIVHSYNTAIHKINTLNGAITPVMRKHLDACVALKKLSESGAIDYCFISCQKPGA